MSFRRRLNAVQPFAGREKAIRENIDIDSTPYIFDRADRRIRIRDTDIGRELKRQADDLKALLQAYHDGVVKEDHGKA